MTLSDDTTLGQSGTGSDGYKESLCIPHSFSISIRLFVVMFRILIREDVLLCSGAVGVFYSPSRLSYPFNDLDDLVS